MAKTERDYYSQGQKDARAHKYREPHDPNRIFGGNWTSKSMEQGRKNNEAYRDGHRHGRQQRSRKR
jgi:hypothetical protein